MQNYKLFIQKTIKNNIQIDKSKFDIAFDTSKNPLVHTSQGLKKIKDIIASEVDTIFDVVIQLASNRLQIFRFKYVASSSEVAYVENKILEK